MIPVTTHPALRRGATLFSLLACAAAGGTPPAHAQEAAPFPQFPTIRGTNLSGRSFSLPRDFEGRLNLVFVAWQREQQAEVDSWLPYAARLTFQNPEVRVYELPTIARGFVLVSPFIAAGMRGGVTDPAARDATITLYTDTRRFRAALGLPHDRTVYALLVDGAGVVRWRSDGPFTPAKGSALSAAVERLLDRAPGPAARR